MAKRYSRLSKQAEQQLLGAFCRALLCVKTSHEAVQFLTDLLTKSEAVMLAKRIQIAKLLLEGKGYKVIKDLLQVSEGTIAKVAAWLADSGEGFRFVAERTKGETAETMQGQDLSEWGKLKRRYPMMFWPQLLLEEVVKSVREREKERIRRAVDKLDHKSRVYRDLQLLLRSQRKPIRKNFIASKR